MNKDGKSMRTREAITFLPPQGVDLGAVGINPDQAAELRARLAAFAPDWDAPEMDVYDDYDAAKSLPTRLPET